MTRVPLAMLMALIGALALELAAMRLASPLATAAAFNLTLFLLLVGLLGAIVRRGEGSWTGFALFGWSYACFSYAPALLENTPNLMTDFLLDDLAATIHPVPGPAPAVPMLNVRFLSEIGDLSNLATYRPGMRSRPYLSSAENKALDAYLDQLDLHHMAISAAGERRNRAVRVGQALFILIFGMIGAILGMLLAKRSPVGWAER